MRWTLHRIALALGKTMKELNQMDVDELAHWVAFFKLRGFGQDRSEFMIAQLTALVRNAIVGRKGKPAKALDFALDEVLKTQEERETETMLKYFEGLSKNAGT